MRVIVLLALTIAAVAAVPRNPQRIVGGSVTTIGQYPSIVALLYSSDLSTYWQTCGGTMITSLSILTAAHCTAGDAINRWRIRIGSSWANSGGVVYSTRTIINHPAYNSWNNDNDISIIRTTTYINHNINARPATVAGTNYNVGDNQVVWAAGWGATSAGGPASEQLRHVQIWTVNQEICAQRYANVGNTVTDNMLCSGWLDVGGRDQCQGDSGGPLYHYDVLIGVCSWGRSCAMAAYPGVNTRVSRYTAWIQANA